MNQYRDTHWARLVGLCALVFSALYLLSDVIEAAGIRDLAFAGMGAALLRRPARAPQVPVSRSRTVRSRSADPVAS